MIPELAIAMLACARIGAVHSIVFGAFSSDSLSNRIQDSSCKILVNHFKKINFNILHNDKLTKSYPYVIEDIGVSFILYLNPN